MKNPKFEVVHDAPMQVGECPLWHDVESALYWVDINGLTVNRVHPASGKFSSWKMGSEPSALAADDDNNLVVATRTGFVASRFLRAPLGPNREALIAEEDIACDFRRAGKLKLASKPGHFEGIARNFEAINREVDPETKLLSATDLKAEIGSPFHGGMLFKKSAMMHMGRFVVGLAEAAVRRGVTLDLPVR